MGGIEADHRISWRSTPEQRGRRWACCSCVSVPQPEKVPIPDFRSSAVERPYASSRSAGSDLHLSARQDWFRDLRRRHRRRSCADGRQSERRCPPAGSGIGGSPDHLAPGPPVTEWEEKVALRPVKPTRSSHSMGQLGQTPAVGRRVTPAAVSQTSSTGSRRAGGHPRRRGDARGIDRVARAGVEPATFHFSGERCYQLSYLAFVRPCGHESDTKAVTTRCDHRFRDPDGTRTRDLRRDRAAR
jgi:hypothetical protein